MSRESKEAPAAAWRATARLWEGQPVHTYWGASVRHSFGWTLCSCERQK